jgi:cGMP-dependent protein kinase
MEKFLKCEKEILSICNYPFIVKFVDSYKDTHFVYLLLEYIEGGDFFDFLADIGICNNTTATFYFGCLLLSIEYLHKNSIVYRDLKPENAAINTNGYLQMIDMGTSKLLIENS